jgi:hypothetical protein
MPRSRRCGAWSNERLLLMPTLKPNIPHTIVERAPAFRERGGKLVFPLPVLDIVT